MKRPSWDEQLVRNIVQPVALIPDITEVTLACERLKREANCLVEIYLDEPSRSWVCAVMHDKWTCSASAETAAKALLSAVSHGWEAS